MRPSPPPCRPPIRTHPLQTQVVSARTLQADWPLGRVDIPLVHLSAEGEEWEQWYQLEPFDKLRAGSRFGSIHLRLKIGPVVSRGGTQLMTSTWSLEERREDCGDEDEEYQDMLPNFLRVTVHQVCYSWGVEADSSLGTWCCANDTWVM